MKTFLLAPSLLLFLGSATNGFAETKGGHEKWNGQGLSYYFDKSLYQDFLEKYDLAEPVLSNVPLWDSHAVELEDNASSHFYYFQSNGVSVVRARWIWNGGASSPPTVVDYYLKDGKVEVISQVGEKSQGDALCKGLEAPLAIVRRNEFRLPDGGGMQGQSRLDAASLSDFAKLFEILAKNRMEFADEDSE